MRVVEMRDARGARCLAQWVWVEVPGLWRLVSRDPLLSEPEARAVEACDLGGDPDPKGVRMPRLLMGFRWYLLDCEPDFGETRRAALDETTETRYSVKRGG